ncbi:MAG: phosphodiester glycosidase family protein [Clostridia bacterium]|nr:phosphodiester glycosidase family protein [Clostridia bacterium]
MGENQPTNRDSYRMLLGIFIGIAAAAVIFFVIFLATRKAPEENPFSKYLLSGRFDEAYSEFDSANKDYYQPFDEYLQSITDNYNNSSATYEDSSHILMKLKSSGFPAEAIDDSIANLDSLRDSKDAYITAEALFSQNKYEEAKESYLKVSESDTNYAAAIQKIADIDAMLQTSMENYAIAEELYLNNDTAAAYEQYQLIVSNGVNTAEAQKKIASIDDLNQAWDAEFDSGSYDKCTYPNAAAAKDGILYLPYSSDSLHAIIKYNTLGGTAEALVISNIKGSLIIRGINIVGDYIYFIAGENVGTGKGYANPYSIYRMKTDGSELALAASGNYTDLIAYKDGFYAASYSDGLIKTDRNLKPIEMISESTPAQMQLVNDKLYYTVGEYIPGDPARYIPVDRVNAQYVYDGSSIEKIKEGTLLQFGIYDESELYSEQVYEFYEKIFIANESDGTSRLIAYDDIKNVFGLVGGNALYTIETLSGKDTYYVYSLENRISSDRTYYVRTDARGVEGIYYEGEMVVFSTADGFVITDSSLNYVNEIDFSALDINSMEAVTDISFENSPEYTDEEVVIVEDEYWHYSNSTYYITIESRYLGDIDTNIFIADIRTTDPAGVRVDSPTDNDHIPFIRKDPLNLARQFSAILACNGDFFDEASNEWTGISIREGIVYKKQLVQDMMAIYPDGSLVCYTAEDNIRYEDLLYDGVRDTLSFGPMLINHSDYGKNIYSHFLAGANPRCSLGMIEPGHYVLIVVDGRQPGSTGITLKRLADLFLEKGCSVAYNLDGGQSATMMFMGEYVNTHDNDYSCKTFRIIGEIVFFGTSDLVPGENN